MTKLRKVMLVVSMLVVSGLVLTSGSIYAQSKKIGFLDLSKLFDSYEKTKEFDTRLETEHKAYEEERNAKIESIKEKQGKLALLKEDEQEKVQQELEDLKAELLQFDREKQTELTKQRDEKIREILLEIEKAASDFAKKKDYDLILNDRVLIYGDEASEVTDPVLDILNANYQKK